jgi:hypothetical protein
VERAHAGDLLRQEPWLVDANRIAVLFRKHRRGDKISKAAHKTARADVRLKKLIQ